MKLEELPQCRPLEPGEEWAEPANDPRFTWKDRLRHRLALWWQRVKERVGLG